MPEIVRLKVDLQENNALAKLQELQKTAQLISGTKISFSVDTKGVEGLSKEALKLATAQAKLATEQEKTARAFMQYEARAEAAAQKNNRVTETAREAAKAQKELENSLNGKTSLLGKIDSESLKLYQQNLITAEQAQKSLFNNTEEGTYRVNTSLQTVIDNIVGLNNETSQITAKTSMFGKVSEDVFTAYTSGATSAYEAMRLFNGGTGIQGIIDEITGVSREISQITADTSVFGRMGDEAFTLYSNGVITAEQAQKYFSESTERTSRSLTQLGNQLRFLAFREIKKAMDDALDTMKAVDSELVTVRKVTGFNEEQLAALEEQAYKTGSALGTTADSYLSAAASFARAGYKEQIADLAELSAKTQLVGDMSAKTANQFLISVDAAYKLGGSVEELSKIIDGANEIDNNYATTMEKLAEGMGIVAPVAAQVGVGVDQLSAALGTITAVTQRSGSEAARALRALMLNIVGDTKTEIEDGAQWTAGEIEGLRDVLRQYIPDVMAAADATGELIDPMEAIGALAKAYKEGTLNAQELMEQVTDISGKLRSSQLLALIQNWDMYESMLDSFTNSVGSADKEVENALTSWDAKVNILKNTWAEFVSNTVKTDWIKGLIDGVTKLISGFGDLGTALALVGAAFAAIKLRGFIEFATKAILQVKAFALSLKGLGTAASASAAALTLVQAAAVALVAAIAIVVVAYNNYKQELKDTAEESLKEAKAANDASLKILTLGEALEATKSNTEEHTKAAKDLAAALGVEGDAAELTAEKIKKLTQAKLEEAETAAFKARSDAAESLKAEASNIFENRVGLDGFDFTDLDKYRGGLSRRTFFTLKKAGGDVEKFITNGGTKYNLRFDKNDAKEILTFYEAAVSLLKEYDQVAKETGDESIFQTDTYKSLKDWTNKLGDTANAYRSALNEEVAANDRKTLAGFLNEVTVDSQENYDKLIKTIQDSDLPLEQQNRIINMLAQAYTEYAEAAANAANSTEKVADSGTQLEEAFSNASQKIKDTAEAIKGELDEDIKGIGDIYDAMSDAADKGYYGSNAFLKSADLLFSDEVREKYADDAAGLMEYAAEIGLSAYMDAIKTGNYSDASAEFWQNIAEQTADGAYVVRNATGEIIASMQDMGDEYAWSFDLGNKSVDEFLAQMASATGVSETVWASFIQSLGMYSEEISEWIAKQKEKGGTEIPADMGYAAEQGQQYGKTVAANAQAEASKHPIVIPVSVQGPTSGSPTSGIGGRAKGKRDSYSGLALVNDEHPADGSKPELIVNNRTGSAYVANHGKPAIVNLSADDMVLTAAETKNAFGGSLPAFAGGKDGWLNTTSPKGGGSSSTSSGGGSSSGSTSSKNPDDILSEFREWVNWYKDKAKEEADKRQEEIDAQIDALKASKEAQEEADKLLELQLAVEEAQKNLLQAQVERTVRYYNEDTKQWEWMADQKAVASAQEKLDDAQKKLDDFKAEQEYQAILDGLQAQKDAIQAQYDAAVKQWEDILKTMEAPARGITEILQDMQNSGVPALKEAAENVGGVLDGFTEIIYGAGTKFDAAINEAVMAIINAGYKAQTAKTETKESKSSGGGGGKTENKKQKVNSAVDRKSGGSRTDMMFDEGGIASGSGYMPKGAVGDEVVIGPSITKDVLSPVKNAQFMNFTRSIRALVEAGTSGNKFSTRNSSIANTNNSRNYYINGVKIGADMANKPMSQVLSTLSIYANESM